jgi:hypothetical protein
VIIIYVFDRTDVVSLKGFGKVIGPQVHNQCQSRSIESLIADVACTAVYSTDHIRVYVCMYIYTYTHVYTSVYTHTLH